MVRMITALREQISLTNGGLNRPYLLQAPPSNGGAALPLLVELHGRGIDAVRFDRLTGFGSLAEEAGFALVLPSASVRSGTTAASDRRDGRSTWTMSGI